MTYFIFLIENQNLVNKNVKFVLIYAINTFLFNYVVIVLICIFAQICGHTVYSCNEYKIKVLDLFYRI